MESGDFVYVEVAIISQQLLLSKSVISCCRVEEYIYLHNEIQKGYVNMKKLIMLYMYVYVQAYIYLCVFV